MQRPRREPDQQSSLFDGHDGHPRRRAPARPVVIRSTAVEDTEPVGCSRDMSDLCASRQWIWNANQRQIGWLLYRSGQPDDATAERVITWSYRLGYGGCLITALYPLLTTSRRAIGDWRAADRPLVEHCLRQTAITVGQECRRLRIRRLVVATGDLDEDSEADLFTWLALFRPTARLSSLGLQSIGVTLDGWPVAPAVPGRMRLPDEVSYRPWDFPRRRLGYQQGRHQATAPF